SRATIRRHAPQTPRPRSDSNCKQRGQVRSLAGLRERFSERARGCIDYANRCALVESVEMMDRSMAVTDAEAIGGGDRGADPGLGVAYRLLEGLALGEACRDGGGQRAAGAVGIFSGDARRGERDRAC